MVQDYMKGRTVIRGHSTRKAAPLRIGALPGALPSVFISRGNIRLGRALMRVNEVGVPNDNFISECQPIPGQTESAFPSHSRPHL